MNSENNTPRLSPRNLYGTTLRIYDNGGKTADRYTILPPRNATAYRYDGPKNWGARWGWACIVSGDNPRGCSGHETATPGHHLGRRAHWCELPDAVQRFACEVFPEFALDLGEIARHFCIAAQWADAPEGTHPRIASQALKVARAFALAFIEEHTADSVAAIRTPGYGAHPDAGSGEAAFGHDLYLTAAGHGVGFSDRAILGAVGDRLADVLRKDWRRWYIEPEFSGGWLRLSAPNFNHRGGERMSRNADKLAVALRNLTATARTFRNVPKDDQEWTTTDDEALDAAFAALAAHDATPTAAHLAAQCHALADALHGFNVPADEPPSTARAIAELRRNLHGMGDWLESLGGETNA